MIISPFAGSVFLRSRSISSLSQHAGCSITEGGRLDHHIRLKLTQDLDAYLVELTIKREEAR